MQDFYFERPKREGLLPCRLDVQEKSRETESDSRVPGGLKKKFSLGPREMPKTLASQCLQVITHGRKKKEMNDPPIIILILLGPRSC